MIVWPEVTTHYTNRINQEWTQQFDIDKVIRKVTQDVCHFLNVDAQNFDINFLLGNAIDIQEYNHIYRQKNTPTNVLSFPYFEIAPAFPENSIVLPSTKIQGMTETLGDVIIAYDVVQEEADIQHKKPKDHFIHLVVHSVLHLFGYDHINTIDQERMETLEIQILDKQGIANPYVFIDTN